MADMQREITKQIIDVAAKIHRHLGNRYRQLEYQRCLSIELKRLGLKFDRDRKKEIFYDGVLIGKRQAAFLVEKIVMVQLRVQLHLRKGEVRQAKNDLDIFEVESGLLLNFGRTSLQFKKTRNKKVEEINRAVQEIVDGFDQMSDGGIIRNDW